MNSPIGGLKTAGGAVVGRLTGGGEKGSSVRTARKDGRQVVSLKLTEREDGCVVLSEVYPVSGMAVDPLTPGPYVFLSVEEATQFVDEALQALVYLGCDVQ